jgi:aminoglycoside phosphotransferase (APT) family kinase protein
MTDVAEELVDHEALARYLAEIDLLGAGETLAIGLLSGGRSNLTFAVDAGDRRLILRRRPLGQVARGANDMAREHRVQSALAGSGASPRTKRSSVRPST